MKQPPKKYDITQCALYKCRNKHRLEHILCLESGDLKQIYGIIDYHSFEIDKKHSTEKRKITAPDITLKQVQKRILYLLQRVIRPAWLISGEKGKCYIDNGKAHQNGQYFLTVDIKKFYDNCMREPVYQFFVQKLKTSPDISKILTDIVTFNSGIPTGCPTSQIIAFYAYSDMFTEIYEAAKIFGCKFTLYVDDMTFSSQNPFSPRTLTQEIDCILRKYGHKPKYPKVKYFSPSEYKLVTGTVITPDQALVAPNSLQKTIYESFQEVKHAVDKPICSVDEAKQLLSLKGQIQAARNIENGKFPEILRIAGLINTPEIAALEQKKAKGYKKYSKKIIITKKAAH